MYLVTETSGEILIMGRDASYYREYYSKTIERRRELHRISSNKCYYTLKGKFRALKGRSKQRNIELLLTIEEYEIILNSPCVYGGGSKPEFSIGADRKDNTKGYTAENSVPCCYKHNVIKGEFINHEDMLEICKLNSNIRACGNKPHKKNQKLERQQKESNG
jgi:hypothetical protein